MYKSESSCINDDARVCNQNESIKASIDKSVNRPVFFYTYVAPLKGTNISR